MKRILKLVTTGMLTTSLAINATACATHNNINPIDNKLDLTKLKLLDNLTNLKITQKENDINNIFIQAISVINSSYHLKDKKQLVINDDISVKFFDSKDSKIEIKDINNLKQLQNEVLVKFYSSDNTSKIINNQESDFISFKIILDKASDQDFANNICNQLVYDSQTSKYNNDFIYFLNNTTSKTINKTTIIQNLKSIIQIPKISGLDTSNYNSDLVSFSFDPDANSYEKEINITVTTLYNQTKGNNYFTVQIQPDLDKILSKQLTELASSSSNNPLTFNKKIKNVNENLIMDEIQTRVKYLTQSNLIWAKKEITVKLNNKNSLNNGIFEFEIHDTSTEQSIINSSDQSTIFKVNFTTSEVSKFSDLKTKLSEVHNPTLSIENLPLLDIIPGVLIDNLYQPVAVKNLLNKFTIKDFATSFLDPNGRYGSLMPRTMPVLDNKGIENNSKSALINQKDKVNEQFWKYISAINNDLKSNGINNPNIDLDSKEFTLNLNNHSTDVHFNLYSLLLNVSPDLIHFHNYIINKEKNNPEMKFNYFFEFIRYLSQPISNENIDSDTTDNFVGVNNELNLRKNNFNNLLHDFIDPFQIRDNTSHLEPISLTIHYLKIFSSDINWNDIAYSESFLRSERDPSQELFKNPINQILSAGKDIGFKINDNINFNFDVWAAAHWNTVSDPVNLKSLHKSELKTYINKNLGFNTMFDNSIISINHGNLFVEGKSSVTNKWEKITDFDNLVRDEIIDLRFNFKDIWFSITSENDPYVTLDDCVMPTFYLTI